MTTQTAKNLYHQYAASLPIIDYHNHLSPQEIAQNKKFSNLTHIWLRGDHYKWRAMRALGVEEKWITGAASDLEKFKVFAACVPHTLRNPLFHWVHLELKNPFGVQTYLQEANADEIYTHCSVMLQEEDFSTQGLLRHFKVEMVCTTDDPCDDLVHHQKAQKDQFGVQLLPGFRPDKILQIADREAFLAYAQRLSLASGTAITDFDSLLAALQQRVNYFHANGCRIADHGLSSMPAYTELSADVLAEFKVFLSKKAASPFSHPEAFAGTLLKELCKMYHIKGWVQQFHLGAMRNNNSRQFQQLGPDSGYDSIGDFAQAKSLSQFLNELEKQQALTKTIIYNLNPSDNEVFASMTGNFSEGGVKGKIQFG
ncbi:MAG: glucuronate isomerase, partial [Chitinophagaceae bacterium]